MPDIRTGIVTSVGKMAKTITVTTTQMLHYPKYNVVSLVLFRQVKPVEMLRWKAHHGRHDLDLQNS